MLEYFTLLAGLILLLLGGDVLVRGAVGLAERLSIPPLIIGLTIVSLGTSAPELFISVKAALDNSGGLAVGNVVGSNIANVLLVLGLPAIIQTNVCSDKDLWRSILVMLAITCLFMVQLSFGTLGRINGTILLALLFSFLWWQYKSALTSRQNPELDYHDEVHDIPSSGWLIGGLLVLGMGLLPLGAGLTVNSAIHFATQWNVSEELIGLSVVAIGTSLPELAATLMAVLRNKSSVAIGNVVGSNIFNIAAIMGITVLIKPVEVGMSIIHLDMWIMFASALLLGFLVHFRQKISKITGLVMTIGYAMYITISYLN